jgi:O-antigen ligase
LALGVIQGLALARFGIKGAAVTLGGIYVFSLFRWPHLALIAALVFLFDGFGLVNTLIHFRIPGVFQLKDLVFVSLFLPLLFNAKWQRRAESLMHNCRVLLVPIVVILVLTTLQMVRTSLQYDLPLNTCIMAGRHYWYYAFLPLAAVYLDDQRKRGVTYTLFLLGVSVLAAIVILQTLILFRGGKLFLVDTIQVQRSAWGPLGLARIYSPGEPALVLGFALAFWGGALTSVTRRRVFYTLVVSLCGLAVVLVNSRMRWVHAFLVVLIPLAFLWPHIPRAGRRLGAATCVLAFSVISIFGWTDRGDGYLSEIATRAVSAWTDFRDKKGTWEYRLDDNQFRFALIREHPLFGLGLVHSDYAWRFGAGEVVKQTDVLSYKRGVTSTDSGIVDLLVNFGLVGGIWAMWYFASVLRFCTRLVKTTPLQGGLWRWVPIPMIAYMTGGVLTFVTLGLFTQLGDIISHSFVLGMLGAGAYREFEFEH